MSEKAGLIETSFADAIAMIATSTESREQTRRHWMTSLRQIAKAWDKPLEVIPARYSAVRADLINLHEVPVGLTAKTLANHKSNVKRALLWLAREKGVPEHGAPLTQSMAGAEVEDQRCSCAVPVVVIDAVLLRKQHRTSGGERDGR